MPKGSFRLWSLMVVAVLSVIFSPVFGASAPADASGIDIQSVDNFSVPFGAVSDLSINGTKFYDKNGNGFMEEGEPGISGWTIRLIQDGDEIANAVTDDQGGYRFSDLAPGRYVVLEDSAEGWDQTAPGGGWYEITLTDKSAQRYDFGDYNGSADRLLAEVEHPLMRPSPEELNRWIGEYEAAPTAPLDLNVAARLEAEPLGEYFSLLGHLQYTPSERNQVSCGNCWAWAGTGVMEIALDVQRSVTDRLSIQYLNSNYNEGGGEDWACCGGWLSDVSNFYSATDKAIPWSNANAHWQDGGRGCGDYLTSVPGSAISTSPSYPITSIEDQTITTFDVGKEAAISNIKNVLNQNKAVWFCFFLPTDEEWNDFEYFWNTQPENAVWSPPPLNGKAMISGEYGGHAVLCVGYDDTDPNNRYWIMLNSWGAPSNRPNGLFRVSMDMNYDDYMSYAGYYYYAFYWQTLEMNSLASFASYNYPTRFIRHAGFFGEVTEIGSSLDKLDASFKIVPGLADSRCVSFESLNFPGYYLRHQGFRLMLSKKTDDQLFKEDATFRMSSGLADPDGRSFESYNYPGFYIRHSGFHLYVQGGSGDLFNADATFMVGPPIL